MDDLKAKRMDDAQLQNAEAMRAWLEKMDRLLGMGPAGAKQARSAVRSALGPIRLAIAAETAARQGTAI